MKQKTQFLCDSCGYESVKWYGKCPGCGAWNTMREVNFAPAQNKRPGSNATEAVSMPVSLCAVDADVQMRVKSGIEELDRVLGGGLVTGSLVLLAGEPGIGKSTLLLQMAAKLANKNVLYLSGEESAGQIKLRARRLDTLKEHIHILCETNLDRVCTIIETTAPDILIVDSIQTLYRSDLSSGAGSVTQVKECAMSLMQIAKTTGLTVVLVGHVTKDGAIAGPRVLEHMVDAVLSFEGDRNLNYRLVRAIKNRFGPTGEIGVFEMKREGLVPVDDPSRVMLEGRPEGVSGTCVCAGAEGSRCMLSEIQALVSKSAYAVPRRMTTGVDFSRASMLLAVLEKRCKLSLFNQDVYLNVVGGFRLDDPGCDLAIALSTASACLDKPLPENLLAIGEIGLAGELRAVSAQNARVTEGKKLGFTKVILPASSKLPEELSHGMEVYYARHLSQAMALVL